MEITSIKIVQLNLDTETMEAAKILAKFNGNSFNDLTFFRVGVEELKNHMYLGIPLTCSGQPLVIYGDKLFSPDEEQLEDGSELSNLLKEAFTKCAQYVVPFALSKEEFEKHVFKDYLKQNS